MRLDALVKLEANVQAILQQIRAAAPVLSVPLIVCLCPSSPAFLDTPERHAFKKRMMSILSAALDETPGVQLLHYEQIDRWYPVDASMILKVTGSAKYRIPSCITAL